MMAFHSPWTRVVNVVPFAAGLSSVWGSAPGSAVVTGGTVVVSSVDETEGTVAAVADGGVVANDGLVGRGDAAIAVGCERSGVRLTRAAPMTAATIITPTDTARASLRRSRSDVTGRR